MGKLPLSGAAGDEAQNSLSRHFMTDNHKSGYEKFRE